MLTAQTPGGWEIRYEGGRLATIYDRGMAVDAIEVAEFDWETGEVTEQIEYSHLHDALSRWVEDYGLDYRRANLPAQLATTTDALIRVSADLLRERTDSRRTRIEP